LKRAEELPAAEKNTVKEFLLAGDEKMVLSQKNIILHLQELCYSLLTRADVNLAYPQAEIAVMGAEGAVNILYRKSAPEEKAEIIKEYEDKFSNPYRAAERGLIDEVIMPRDTRYKLIQALEMCHNKNQSNPPKKHGNMPL
jgi:acetyl-CoA carboxylase carboxyltransferase component